MESLRKEFTRLNTSVCESNKRLDAVELRVAAVEERLDARASDPAPDRAVTELVDHLKSQLNEREQESLINDIQITGLPESSGENTEHIVGLVFKKVGIDVDHRDIVTVARKGAKNPNIVGEQPRPRPIVVRLARTTVKDSILRAARVRRGLDTTGILEGPSQRIYLNEYLTKFNRVLFYKAREESRRHNAITFSSPVLS
ncbi:uncharacterized protein LOC121728094 [Aricia agestis]|uniref:uncharacterized protein LOC121728094 n=1 Tax=Aricia agestis TaxID=91739 RepID=UPI001C206FD2|nr:uncharacterized protein LOC121728094 [Aricia agestis]